MMNKDTKQISTYLSTLYRVDRENTPATLHAYIYTCVCVFLFVFNKKSNWDMWETGFFLTIILLNVSSFIKLGKRMFSFK